MDENQPAALNGGGLSGPRPSIAPAVVIERRNTMKNLIASGLDDDEIELVMNSQFGMLAEDIRTLRERMIVEIQKDSERRKPYNKALAETRIHRHIRAAAKRQAWGAVAQLENQLSRIQGTEEPTQHTVSIHGRLSQATIDTLGGLPPEMIQEMVEEESRRLGDG